MRQTQTIKQTQRTFRLIRGLPNQVPLLHFLFFSLFVVSFPRNISLNLISCFQVALLSTNAIKRDPEVEAPSVTQKMPELATQMKEIPIDHFGKHGNTTGDEEYRMPHPVWY